MVIAHFKQDFRETAAALAKFKAAARQALYRQGGFIRTTAKNSMKSGSPNNPSRPGEPPHSITGLLKKFLFFSWDSMQQSVVIGPAAFKADPTTPRLLEEGGQESARVCVGRHRVRKQVTIAPRPYMAPALQASQKKLPDYWANSIKVA